MPVYKSPKWKPEVYPPGIMYQDPTALTDCQDACTNRLGMSIQIEQNSYLLQHPEISALIKIFISKSVGQSKSGLKHVAKDFFQRPVGLIEEDVRKFLNIPYGEPLNKGYQPYDFKDWFLENDLYKLTKKNQPDLENVSSTSKTPSDTVSSSFLSIITSQTTLPTPEKVKTPEPTLSETMFGYVQLAMNKAVFLNVRQYELLYDTAYVEMMKIVEDAIEMTVQDIKEDIATLFFNAFQMFELHIMEKERIAAEIAWERRMRKKMKKSLRKLANFKGYETPESPKSTVSSHDSYKIPPLRPCECHPQFFFNRYPKDRFGIYEPRDMGFSHENVTTTPAVSLHEIEIINEIDVEP